MKLYVYIFIWLVWNVGYFFNLYTTILTNLKNSDISNKINDYSQSNDIIGKVIESVGNIGEQVSIQAKKEQAYIKGRTSDDSTELFDDNEFFISKVVLDGVDYVSGKKQEMDEAKKK